MRMRHIAICDLIGSTVFVRHHINGTIKKKYIDHISVCFDFIRNFYLQLSSFQEELSEILLKRCIGLHVKYRLFLSDFYEIFISWTDFRKKKTQISNLTKIRTVGAELFQC